MEKYRRIKELFEQHSDAEQAQQMAAYMRHKFDFYGLPTPQRKALTREFLKEEKKRKVIDWDFLDLCYADPHREFQYLVIDYLGLMQRFLTYDDLPRLLNYIKNKQWWDSIDGLDKIVAAIGEQDARIARLMLDWSVDDDMWLRRIAIDHQLGRKEKTDTALLERIVLNNLGSSEFFINKAIGWSLREYSKTDPLWVRDFIAAHRENMDKLSIREASKYLS